MACGCHFFFCCIDNYPPKRWVLSVPKGLVITLFFFIYFVSGGREKESTTCSHCKEGLGGEIVQHTVLRRHSRIMKYFFFENLVVLV